VSVEKLCASSRMRNLSLSRMVGSLLALLLYISVAYRTRADLFTYMSLAALASAATAGLILDSNDAYLAHVAAGEPVAITGCESCHGAKVQIDPHLLDMTIRAALTHGGDFADVYVENRIARSIVMEESRFKSAEFGVSQGAGVRVIAGDKTGYAYTEEITEEALRRAAEVASYIARGTAMTEPVSIGAPTQRQTFGSVRLPLEDIADSRRLEIMELIV